MICNLRFVISPASRLSALRPLLYLGVGHKMRPDIRDVVFGKHLINPKRSICMECKTRLRRLDAATQGDGVAQVESRFTDAGPAQETTASHLHSRSRPIARPARRVPGERLGISACNDLLKFGS